MRPWRSLGAFQNEASEYADGVLVALKGRAILVPALWSVEITNAVLMAERRKRSNNLRSGALLTCWTH